MNSTSILKSGWLKKMPIRGVFFRCVSSLPLQLNLLSLAISVIAVIFTAILAFALIQRVELKNNVEAHVGSLNGQVFEVEFESLRLKQAMAVAMWEPQSLDRDNLMLRNDIFSSRIELLRAYPSISVVASIPEYAPTISALEDINRSIEEALAVPRPSPAVLAKLLSKLNSLEIPIHTLSHKVMLETSHNLEAASVRLMYQNGLIFLLTLTLLAFLTVAAVSMSQRRKQRDLERDLLHQTNNQLRQKQLELTGAWVEAEKANRAKSDFLASMSHELRTPLNSILGFAQLIETGMPPPTPSQKRNLDYILNGGWYLLELINEVLDLAQVESGELSLSLESVSLIDILHHCHGLIEPLAHKRAISVTFTQLEMFPLAFVDRIRVKQVILNLLSNAIKYNQPGGSVAAELSLHPPNFARISIRDTGMGMTPNQIEQLFQPFNRLGREAGAEAGTGIGLVVTKRLVELMEGKVGVESTPGTGSVFWIDLPLADTPWHALAPTQRPSAELPGLPSSSLLHPQ
jgi:signal transduction histidine kinase